MRSMRASDFPKFPTVYLKKSIELASMCSVFAFSGSVFLSALSCFSIPFPFSCMLKISTEKKFLLKAFWAILGTPVFLFLCCFSPGGVLNFGLGTDVRPEVSTTTL